MTDDENNSLYEHDEKKSDPSMSAKKKSETERQREEIIISLRRQLDRIINDAPQHQLPIGAINCYYYCVHDNHNGYITYSNLEDGSRAEKDREIMEWLLTNSEHLKKLSEENIELLHKDMPMVDKIINFFGGNIQELQHCYTDEIEWYKKAQQEVFAFKRLKNEYEQSKADDQSAIDPA